MAMIVALVFPAPSMPTKLSVLALTDFAKNFQQQTKPATQVSVVQQPAGNQKVVVAASNGQSVPRIAVSAQITLSCQTFSSSQAAAALDQPANCFNLNLQPPEELSYSGISLRVQP